MQTNEIRVHNALELAKCRPQDFQFIAEESYSASRRFRGPWCFVCLIMIALLVLSSITSAQVKSRQLSDFSEGLVAVNEPTREPKEKEQWFKYWGKCGYRNTKGEWVIPAQFDWAGPFNEGYALVVIGARVHVENVKTKWESLYGGLAKKRDTGIVLLFDGGRQAVIDKTGRVLIELPRLAGKLGIRFLWQDDGYQSKSNILTYMDSEWRNTYYVSSLSFQEGRAVVEFPDGCNYLQKSGDSLAYAFPQPFSKCGPFLNGLAAVSDSSKKWGFIGTDGLWQVPARYDNVYPFSEGLSAAKTVNLWGFIGMDGQWRIPATYQQVSSFSEGLATVKIGERWGAIDKTGAIVIPAKYRRDFSFSEGLAVVEDDHNVLFIDNRGQTVAVLDIMWAWSDAGRFHEGLVLMSTREYGSSFVVKSEYLDRTGNTVYRINGKCKDFSDGVAECEDTYQQGSSIRFDKLGRIISKHGDSASLEKDLAAPQDPQRRINLQ
jgi:hypothetical protein